MISYSIDGPAYCHNAVQRNQVPVLVESGITWTSDIDLETKSSKFIVMFSQLHNLILTAALKAIPPLPTTPLKKVPYIYISSYKYICILSIYIGACLIVFRKICKFKFKQN